MERKNKIVRWLSGSSTTVSVTCFLLIWFSFKYFYVTFITVMINFNIKFGNKKVKQDKVFNLIR
jgi:hypothetical protein